MLTATALLLVPLTTASAMGLTTASAMGLTTASAMGLTTAAMVAPAGAAEVAEEQIDLSGLEPLDPRIRAELEGKLRKAVAEAASKHEFPAAKIRVAVGWNDVATFDYKLNITIEAHEGMDARTDARPTGADTKESDLGDVLEAALDRLLTEWQRAAAAAAAAGAGAGGVIIENPPPPPPDEKGPARRSPLGAMGWAGVGLLVAGAGSVGGGVGLFVLGRTDHPSEATKLRDWQPGAIAFTIAGGAAMITGAALIAVDARRRAADRKVRLAPAAGPTGGGLMLSGRF